MTSIQALNARRRPARTDEALVQGYLLLKTPILGRFLCLRRPSIRSGQTRRRAPQPSRQDIQQAQSARLRKKTSGRHGPTAHTRSLFLAKRLRSA